jgi:hypothetical protein
MLIFASHLSQRRTLLPNPVLEELLPQFAERILERQGHFILTRPKKRRILLKLLALRTFLLAPQTRARRAILAFRREAASGRQCVASRTR